VRVFEVAAANNCYILMRHEEALFHAEEAIRIDEALNYYPHYNRALALIALGFGPQAVSSMRRALELGCPSPSMEISLFFLRAAVACEEAGLPVSAVRAYRSAIDASPDAQLRAEAAARIRELTASTAAEAALPDEVARIARWDDALARVPRMCPARRR
jgi:tetratricopeptide (TPR) repeat protein